MAGAKRTVAIDDDLLREVRERIGEGDQPAAELIEAALRRFIDSLPASRRDARVLATLRAEARLEGRSEDEVTMEDVRRHRDNLAELETTLRELQASGPHLPEDEGLALVYEELRSLRAERAQRVNQD